MVQATLYSTNRNNIQSSDANGSADYWPIRHQSDVGQWLCWLANQQPATVTTIAEQINPSLIDQMCPRGSLFIQTRDAVFGILETTSVYSDTVPSTLPGIRERTMLAGGSIEWESTENSEQPNQDHLADAGTEHPEPSPEPTPDFHFVLSTSKSMLAFKVCAFFSS